MTSNLLQIREKYLIQALFFLSFFSFFLVVYTPQKIKIKTLFIFVYISNSLYPAGGKDFPTRQSGYIPPDKISSA